MATLGQAKSAKVEIEVGFAADDSSLVTQLAT
jgi:hypothetical protein